MFVISKNKAWILCERNPDEKLWKIYSLAYEFSFFVISISVQCTDTAQSIRMGLLGIKFLLLKCL
jgi:hypothetical protein